MDEDFMERDHEEVSELLGQLELTLKGGGPHRAFELLDLVWARLAVHIRAEHLHLFPALLEAVGADSGPSSARVREAIDRLRNDHNFFMLTLAEGIKTMRELTQVAIDDERVTQSMAGLLAKIEAVVDRLEAHNRVEATEVYRWPAMVLSSEAQLALADNLRFELRNMPPRFDDPDLSG